MNRLREERGLELAQQIKESIHQVCEFPESVPIARGEVRSLLIQPSTRWHFTLHYRVESDRIWILALAHQTRSPFYWLEMRTIIVSKLAH